MPRARKPRITIDIMVEAGAWPPKRTLKSIVEKAVGAALDEVGAGGANPGEQERGERSESTTAHVSIL